MVTYLNITNISIKRNTQTGKNAPYTVRPYTLTHVIIHRDLCLFMHGATAANHFANFFVFAPPHYNNILLDPSPPKCSFTFHPSHPHGRFLNSEPLLNAQS